jgi:hypothetical protein
MKFEEANKNSKRLFTRINLKEDEVKERLLHYFIESDVAQWISNSKLVKAYSDGNIVLMYDRFDETYTLIANACFMELIKP